MEREEILRQNALEIEEMERQQKLLEEMFAKILPKCPKNTRKHYSVEIDLNEITNG